MLATGVIGAWVFAMIGSKPEFGKAKGFAGTLLVVPLVVLIAAFGIHLYMQPDREYEFEDYPAENYRVSVLADGLEYPWGMVLLPDGRYLITERTGGVRIVDSDGALLNEPLAGVPEVLMGVQGGMLDIQLSPNFQEDSYVYLSYACGTKNSNNTCVSRGKLQGRSLQDVERIFQAKPLKDASVQFGSRIVFLPDETMVVSIGDGGDYREEAQNVSRQLLWPVALPHPDCYRTTAIAAEIMLPVYSSAKPFTRRRRHDKARHGKNSERTGRGTTRALPGWQPRSKGSYPSRVRGDERISS